MTSIATLPYVISSSGVYKLIRSQSNLTTTSAITVNADNVTILGSNDVTLYTQSTAVVVNGSNFRMKNVSLKMIASNGVANPDTPLVQFIASQGTNASIKGCTFATLGGDCIIANGYDNIRVSECHLSGSTIASDGITKNGCVHVLDANVLIISGCKFNNNDFACVFNTVGLVSITECDFKGNSQTNFICYNIGNMVFRGCYLDTNDINNGLNVLEVGTTDDPRPVGACSLYDCHVTVTKSGTGFDGLVLLNGSDCRMERCTITTGSIPTDPTYENAVLHISTNIVGYSYSNVHITDCDIVGFTHIGLLIDGLSRNIIIERCRVQGFADMGVVITNAMNSYVSSNIITSSSANANGVVINDGSQVATICDNEIKVKGTGVVINTGATGVTISHNDINAKTKITDVTNIATIIANN